MPLADNSTPDQIAAYLVAQNVDPAAVSTAMTGASRAKQVAAVSALFTPPTKLLLATPDWKILKTVVLAAPVSKDLAGLAADALAAAAADDQHRFLAAALMVLQLLNYKPPAPGV